MTEHAPMPASRPDDDSLHQLDDILSAAIHSSLDGLPLSDEVNAPVLMPARDELAIRLVPLHTLERFHQAESDQNVATSALWCLIGTILGFATNIVTSGQKVSTAALVFASLVTIATVVVAIWRRRLAERVRPLKSRIFTGHVDD